MNDTCGAQRVNLITVHHNRIERTPRVFFAVYTRRIIICQETMNSDTTNKALRFRRGVFFAFPGTGRHGLDIFPLLYYNITADIAVDIIPHPVR